MFLPEYVRRCVDALERRGFACYAVGGCVRDSLLGLTPQDYDLCTDALPGQIRDVFSGSDLVLAGEKHGTVGVITPEGVVEITTFRTEGNYTDNRHPGWVKFVSTVDADLSRRDFTVNAMAYSPTRGFADPFGGQRDLQNRNLRAVGDASARFREDALRILRGMRFSVRFHLVPEDATFHAMKELAPLLQNIARERVFEELCKLLPLVKAEDLLLFAPILAQVIPELSPTMGFCQHNAHHLYDIFTHTAHVCAGVPADLPLRWAALLHDIGKVPTFTLDDRGVGHFYGHAKVSAQMADAVLLSLKAPTALREEAVFLVAHHMDMITPDRKLLRRALSKWGADWVLKLITLQKADYSGKGVVEDAPPFDTIRAMTEEILREESCLTLHNLAVDGNDMMALGLAGPAIGECLNRLLEKVLEEELPNEKTALLEAARRMQL